MPNINAFWTVVHEKKIFEDLTKSESPSPLMFPTKFGWNWFLRRSRLKEKVNGRTDGQTDAGQIEMAIAKKEKDYQL